MAYRPNLGLRPRVKEVGDVGPQDAKASAVSVKGARRTHFFLGDSTMDERIRFVTHEGKQILLVDFTNCPAREVEQTARNVPNYVTVQPRGSVLVLADFTGASIDREAIRAMKESAVFDKPYIKKSAWVGAEKFPDVLRT